jgi:multidrug efflux pump subunit AcrB
VVEGIKAALPRIRATLPEGVRLDLLLDQSVFVRAAVTGVVTEAVIAACLTGLMILLFLGSWRSTLIVVTSIPLAILSALVVLGALGHTLNTLTLGGLALAVGMLVDDATVAVENTTRNLELGQGLRQAILTSAQQIALPTLTATLSICIVFVPVAFLTGVGGALFLPLALAVVFAMLPSYWLARTLVTTMLQALVGRELHLYEPPPSGGHSVARGNLLWRRHEKFEGRFEALRERYRNALHWALGHRALTGLALGLFFGVSACLQPSIGGDFFPAVDAGQMRLHARAPAGTRLEETGRLFNEIEDAIRQVIPARDLELILDNIGVAEGTAGAYNYALSNSGTIGAADGEIAISLRHGHRSTWAYQAELSPICSFRNWVASAGVKRRSAVRISMSWPRRRRRGSGRGGSLREARIRKRVGGRCSTRKVTSSCTALASIWW